MEPLRARMDFESGPLPERSGAEVGRFEVTKTESNCEANKRLRIALSDGQVARRQQVAVPAGSRTPASVRSSSPAPTCERGPRCT